VNQAGLAHERCPLNALFRSETGTYCDPNPTIFMFFEGIVGNIVEFLPIAD
jgi:hypothetical protein